MIKGQPRVLISAKGREYRGAIAAADGPRVTRFGQARVAVEVTLCPPDRRRRDLDNHMKGLLDGLTFAGVWADDEQVDSLTILRGPVVPGGSAIVTIHALPAGHDR